METTSSEGISRVLSGRTSRRAAVRNIGAAGLTAGLLGLVGRVSGAASVAAAELANPVATPLLIPFEATIRQGPDAGTAYTGFLNLSVAVDGHATGGFLTTDGAAIPVTGQITGQSVGLLFTPAEGHYIYGVGVSDKDLVGLNGFATVAVGGTLVGPNDGDSGDWAVIPPGGTITIGKKSAMCKTCLQSCRNGFGFGGTTPSDSDCRSVCTQFGDAGYGGCSSDDFGVAQG